MGREIEPWPKGACDACGHVCWSFVDVGRRCCYCHAGIFMHEKWWVWWRVGPIEWLVSPREDIDVAELEAEWARLRR